MPNQYLPPVIQTPSSLLIAAITQAYPMVVTTSIGNPSTEANIYIPGMAIKLFIPVSYGMQQAHGKIATIVGVNGSQITLNIDSSQFDAFVVPSSPSAVTPASISPAGSRNLQYNNSNINIVPFQSYNNIGN